jgi:Flp pilus assembly protein CpaB
MKCFPLFRRIFRKISQSKKFPVPTISIPYTHKINQTRRKFFVLFLVLLISTLFYSYVWQQQRQVEFDLVPVLVSRTDLMAPEEITGQELRLKYFSRQNIPVVTFSDENEITGLTLIRDVVRNEILLPHHFQPNINPESISTKFSDFFAFSLNEDWFEGKLPNLMPHDRVDILAVNPKSNRDQATILAENLEVIEVLSFKKNNAKTLIVNTTNQEAESILLARGSRLPMQVLVRSSVTGKIKNNQNE